MEDELTQDLEEAPLAEISWTLERIELTNKVTAIIQGDRLLENVLRKGLKTLESDEAKVAWLKRVLDPPLATSLFTRYPVPPNRRDELTCWASEYLLVFPETSDEDLNINGNYEARVLFGTWDEYTEQHGGAGFPCCGDCAEAKNT